MTLIRLEDQKTGAVVEIGPNTPRTRMIKAALLRKVAPWYEDYAASIGVEALQLDVVMTEFITLSSSLRNPQGLDFELLTLADSQDMMLEKFNVYLDTELSTFLRGAIDGIKRLDAPGSPNTSPTPLGPDAAKN